MKSLNNPHSELNNTRICKFIINLIVKSQVAFHFLQFSKLNEKGESMLHRACISGNVKQVKKLLEQVSVEIFKTHLFSPPPLTHLPY